jgi:hypothetical protein
MTAVYGYYFLAPELAGKKPETERGTSVFVRSLDFTGNLPDPAVSHRTCFTWDAKSYRCFLYLNLRDIGEVKKDFNYFNIICFCFGNKRFCVRCEVNLNYIELTKTWGYYSCVFVNKFAIILLYESYTIMQDHIGGAYIDLFVSIDIRFQRLRFWVRFFVRSYMILYDIEVISDMIGQESEIDLII